MKNIIKTMALAMMTICAISVSAAEKTVKSVEQEAKAAVASIAKMVDLKSDQVQALTAKFVENAKAKAAATTEDAKKELNKKNTIDIKSILTAEQYKKYESAKKAATFLHKLK